jgi:hypothetical protein
MVPIPAESEIADFPAVSGVVWKMRGGVATGVNATNFTLF